MTVYYSCYICSRDILSGGTKEQRATAITDGTMRKTHHLLPRSLHDSMIASGIWTREECLSTTVELCTFCHDAAHGYFTNEEMARYLSTARRLKEAMLEIGWIP